MAKSTAPVEAPVEAVEEAVEELAPMLASELAASDNMFVRALFTVTKSAQSPAHADKTKARREWHAETDLRGIIAHITGTYTDADEQSAAFATLRHELGLIPYTSAVKVALSQDRLDAIRDDVRKAMPNPHRATRAGGVAKVALDASAFGIAAPVAADETETDADA